MQEKEFLKQIGKRIAYYRKKRGFTQEHLGDETDMERSAIARIEAGRQNVTAGILLKIGKALKVSVAKFLIFTTN